MRGVLMWLFGWKEMVSRLRLSWVCRLFSKKGLSLSTFSLRSFVFGADGLPLNEVSKIEVLLS